MENKEKYYLLLNRFTNLEIKKEDVKEYLEECYEYNTKPNSRDFLDYLGYENCFSTFDENIEDTDIEDDTQFYQLIKEIREND
jgi:hypothetical protein